MGKAAIHLAFESRYLVNRGYVPVPVEENV
jgi:hypothetical protein